MKDKKILKSNTLRVRLSEHEMNKLQTYADTHEWTVSHVIREYIRRLPNSKSLSQYASSLYSYEVMKGENNLDSTQLS